MFELHGLVPLMHWTGLGINLSLFATSSFFVCHCGMYREHLQVSSRVSCLSDDSSMCTLPALAASSGMPSIVPNGRIGNQEVIFLCFFWKSVVLHSLPVPSCTVIIKRRSVYLIL